ncbi:MAG TPA: hypothetical protein VLA93_02475 [Pyrinomonadaceae bacterium]|nr:hypothetical protein [Pyrinomonadaceae bacterium]
MQRCPQCEFIYEDDQLHCDMDGTRLVHDAHALPKLQALNTTTSMDKPKARSRIIAVTATLVLAGVMALVYYVSIRQPPRTTAVAMPPSADAAHSDAEVSPASAPDTAPDTTLAPQSDGSEKAPTENSNKRARTTPESPSVAESEDSKPEAKPSPKTDTARTTKATSQTRSTPQSAGTTTKPEDESKVKSALKKTGRFFKKALPF